MHPRNKDRIHPLAKRGSYRPPTKPSLIALGVAATFSFLTILSLEEDKGPSLSYKRIKKHIQMTRDNGNEHIVSLYLCQ